jgi:hypothetical protein
MHGETARTWLLTWQRSPSPTPSASQPTLRAPPSLSHVAGICRLLEASTCHLRVSVALQADHPCHFSAGGHCAGRQPQLCHRGRVLPLRREAHAHGRPEPAAPGVPALHGMDRMLSALISSCVTLAICARTLDPKSGRLVLLFVACTASVARTICVRALHPDSGRLVLHQAPQ